MAWRDIPEDIRKTAEALSEKYVDEGPSDEEVANAILAERQRCAALCRASASQSQEIYPAGQDRGIARAVADNIAKAIEEGTQP